MAADAGSWSFFCYCLYFYRFSLALLLFFLFLTGARAGKLYGPEDPLTVLDSGSVKQALFNSSTAWLLEFYSSWCGHCVNYAPTWKALASDVRDWETVIRIGVLDCADEENHEICKEFDVQLYPTFRFFKALTKEFTSGENYKAGSDREVQTVRQMIIDYLQNASPDSRPSTYPSLDPLRSSVAALLDKKAAHYTAILFESDNSYLGREVILDLIQYENIVVNRALDSDKALLEQLGIASIPSCYLIYPNGSHGPVNILKPIRSSFSSYLKSLPDVRKKLSSQPIWPLKQRKEESNEDKVWKEFDNSKLYMADLESGLHYLLRMELAIHKTLEGNKLKTFKDFITIMSKLFPGRQPVAKLLETLQEWLVNLPLDKIPYDAILDLVNNKMRISGIFLTNRVHWIGCRGSRSELRGYPCSLWKLFHSLTVQAALQPEALTNMGFENSPQIILQVMRRYIQYFFGCRECAQHFEEMAKDSMDLVKTLDQAVLWLWKKHNTVNRRLAGTNSEDPKFPKIQWPPPDLCPRCHEEIKGLYSWNEAEVLAFLKHYYSSENISQQFLDVKTSEDETQQHVVENKEADHGLPKRYGEHGQNKDLQNLKNAADMKPDVLDELIQENRPASKKKGQDGVELVAIHSGRKQSLSFLGIGFSNIDMSLCVVLYITSSLFLMVMFFFFRMRSRRWKIRYNRPYV